MSSYSIWKIKNKETGEFLTTIVKGEVTYNKFGKLFNKKHLAEKTLAKLGVDTHEIIEFSLVEVTSSSEPSEEVSLPPEIVACVSSWDNDEEDDMDDDELIDLQ